MVWEWSIIAVELLKTFQMKKLLSFSILLLCTTIFAQVPSYVPTNGLVGYWPFNGNANDESGNGNNGVVNGATLAADRMGNDNSAYNLDGVNDYITIPDSPSLRLSNATISSWISYTSASKMMLMVKHNLLDAYNSNYAFEINEYTALKGPRVLGMYDNGNCNSYNWTNYHSNTDIGDNQWHHLVGTFGNDFLKIYIDGNFIGQIATPNSVMNACAGSELLLGRGWSGFPLWYNGKLDDLSIWNRVLTESEITNLYNQVPSYSDTCNAVSGSLTQGLVGYWPFCGNANDDSGHGNNGTVNGATLTNDRFGNSNSAYDFDGIDDGITLPGNVLPYNANSYSISFWCKLNIVSSHTDSWTVFDDRDNLGFDSKGRFIVNVNNSNDAWYQMSDAGPQVHTSNFSTTTWTNIICVYDNLNNQMILYKDGVFVSSVPCTSNWYLPGNRPLNIGRGESPVQFTPNSYYVEHWQGEIDDIGIWNRALTPSEISQLYNQNQCFTNTTVTDTLVINVGQLSYTNPIAYANNITLYPNPANTQVNISFNNITDLSGGTINIINSLGQQVATTPITLSGTSTSLSLTTWGGTGLYFVQILNAQGQILDIKKIILQ